MRTHFISKLVLSFTFVTSCPTLAGVLDKATLDEASRELRSSNRDLDFQGWRWAYEQRADRFKGIPAGVYFQAHNEIRSFKLRRPLYATENEHFWTSIGPSPLLGGQIPSENASGRLKAIVVDSSNTNHWFIAADGGGVWETTDAGVSWIPRTDDLPSLQMSVLCAAPGNPLTLYGGTGNYGGYASAGITILSSTNGGTNWTFFEPSEFTNVNYFSYADMIVSPSNSSVLLAAASDMFGPTPSTGIFKSTNGGAVWSQRLAGVASALIANPRNFNQQFVGLRTIYKPPSGSDDPSNGVYSSFDAGDTWQRLNGPWGAIPDGGDPILLAIAPSDTNTLYVSIGKQSLWRSTNAWSSSPIWTNFTLPLEQNGDTAGFARIIVDPTNSLILYAGAVDLFKLIGTSWSDITGITHVDQHAMAWAGRKFLIGNDGGLWSSVDSGNSWSNHNAQLGTIEYYRGSLHPTNANFALGGSQDNGSEKWAGTNTWQFLYGGDGQANAIATALPDLRWAVSAQEMWIERTTNGWVSDDRVDGGIEQANRPWGTLFLKSPTNDDVFITATHRMWKTTNFFTGPTVSWFTNGPDMSNAITAMGFAPSDLSGNTYAYSSLNMDYYAPNAPLRLTTNGGVSWVDIDPGKQVPNRTVTGLAFALSDANILYVTLSGFDGVGPSPPGHLFKTANALSSSPTWTNVSPPVNLPFNAIVADGPNGENVFAGSDIGVWHSSDGGANWTHMGPEVGMPNVVVNDLQLSSTAGRLVAFTYGRGAYALVNSTNVSDLSFTDERIVGADMLLTFKTVLGRTYLVQGTTNLPGAWSTVISNVPGTGNLVTVVDVGAANRPKRFYRATTLY